MTTVTPEKGRCNDPTNAFSANTKELVQLEGQQGVNGFFPPNGAPDTGDVLTAAVRSFPRYLLPTAKEGNSSSTCRAYALL